MLLNAILKALDVQLKLNMRLFSHSLVALVTAASTTFAVSAWSFEDATLTIQEKGAGVGGGVKEKYGIPSRGGKHAD